MTGAMVVVDWINLVWCAYVLINAQRGGIKT